MNKDAINWGSVPPQYRYLARDRSGLAFLFGSRPILNEARGMFQDVGGFLELVREGYAGYRPGACDWTESLVERPHA